MRAAKIILLVIIACASLSFAQQTGRITGIVVDVNGSRVVGAAIRIESSDFKQTKRSDDEGRFELEAPAGTYELTVEQSGFKKYRRRDVRVGSGTRELGNVQLEVAPPKMPVKIN
jgi:iron complex outermembrane recepter protein